MCKFGKLLMFYFNLSCCKFVIFIKKESKFFKICRFSNLVFIFKLKYYELLC